jgi:hypothetical protein
MIAKASIGPHFNTESRRLIHNNENVIFKMIRMNENLLSLLLIQFRSPVHRQKRFFGFRIRQINALRRDRTPN